MKTKLFYGVLLTLIFGVFCLEATAQTVGDTFQKGGFTFEITSSSSGSYEVSVIDYLDVNNLTPSIPLTAAYGSTYNVTSIGENAFANNSLTSVIIPSSVTSIGENAFTHNSLTGVTIPSSVISIGEYAFRYNSLTSITIPSSVTSIGNYAFYSNSIENLTLGNNVETIGDRAFSSNLITSLDIPDSVTLIGDYAFSYNNTLSTLSLGNSVESIGTFAFYHSVLETITIPATVTAIGQYAFSSNNPSVFTSVVLESSTPITLEPQVFSQNSPFNRNVVLTVPAGTEQSYFNAGWTGFKSINAIQTVFTENDIVYGVTDLTNNEVSAIDYTGTSTSVSIPDTVVGSNIYSVTSIDDYAFYEHSLVSVTIGNSVTTIGEGAFYDNSLVSVTIGESVTSIGDYAFYDNTSLTEVISESITPATLPSNTFDDNSTIDLTIPTGTSTAYTSALWTGFASTTEDSSLGVNDIAVLNELNFVVTAIALNITSTSVIENIQVYALTGAKVAFGVSNEIAIGHLATGIYVAHIQTEKGIATKKFVKK